MMGATASASLKDTGQRVGLGLGPALVGGDGLGRRGVVGKSRDGEQEKEENSTGKSFHNTLRFVGG